MKMIWSHDEQHQITLYSAENWTVRCKRCGHIVNRYVKSHYTGGEPCVLLAKYCRHCGESLN